MFFGWQNQMLCAILWIHLIANFDLSPRRYKGLIIAELEKILHEPSSRYVHSIIVYHKKDCNQCLFYMVFSAKLR